MELCLYDDEFGYYSRNAGQFGKAGDFYTSSDVHAVFGRLLARQFKEMWRVLGSPAQIEVRELGPGRGLFAQDVLGWSEKKFPEFFSALRYTLIERSPALRQQIERTLERHLNSGKATLADPKVVAEEQRFSAANVSPRHNEALAAPTPTILFANEFFDALPVEIVSARGSLRIDARDGHFFETWALPSREELGFLTLYSVFPVDDERVEVPLAAQRAADELLAQVKSGFAIFIDYGYTGAEQGAGRHRGTIKAIRRHAVSATPYEATGEQDITADVNFTALAALAKPHGLHAHRLITQSQFLLGIGESTQFADAFEGCVLPQERVKVALQLKHLVTPAGMGENFHVLMMSKGVDPKSVEGLAGLSFGRIPLSS